PEVQEAALVAVAHVFPEDAEIVRRTRALLRVAKVPAGAIAAQRVREAFDLRMKRSVNPLKEALYDRVIDLYILADGNAMGGILAGLSKRALDQLPPDSIFAVIRGLNKMDQAIALRTIY